MRHSLVAVRLSLDDEFVGDEVFVDIAYVLDSHRPAILGNQQFDAARRSRAVRYLGAVAKLCPMTLPERSLTEDRVSGPQRLDLHRNSPLEWLWAAICLSSLACSTNTARKDSPSVSFSCKTLRELPYTNSVASVRGIRELHHLVQVETCRLLPRRKLLEAADPSRHVRLRRNQEINAVNPPMRIVDALVRASARLAAHCKIIRNHCNVIRTLLQLNSNNHKCVSTDCRQLSCTIAL